MRTSGSYRPSRRRWRVCEWDLSQRAGRAPAQARAAASRAVRRRVPGPSAGGRDSACARAGAAARAAPRRQRARRARRWRLEAAGICNFLTHS